MQNNAAAARLNPTPFFINTYNLNPKGNVFIPSLIIYLLSSNAVRGFLQIVAENILCL